MTIVYATTLKNTRLQALVTVIDGGGGSPTAGRLQIGTADFSTLLSEITLALPCGTVSGGILTFAGLPLSATALATGTAAEARLIDSADVVWASGITVGTSGTNILFNTTAFTAGQPVTITAATITHG